MPTNDLYAILGIPPDAGLGTIKRAYRYLVFAAHPDTGRRPDPARFNDVLRAYQVLSDGDRRRSTTRQYEGPRGLHGSPAAQS